MAKEPMHIMISPDLRAQLQIISEISKISISAMIEQQMREMVKQKSEENLLIKLKLDSRPATEDEKQKYLTGIVNDQNTRKLSGEYIEI